MKPTQDSPVLHVYLIKPSKYDDEGYVIRHWRGIVPSNTLACLYSLTEDVRETGALAPVQLKVHVVDETVAKVPLLAIARSHRPPRERAVACLVGVQSNQFERAADIALALRREGVPVMMGGFHPSGMLAMFPQGSPEIRRLVEAGVSLVAGEIEGRWAELLRDAATGRLQPIYRFLDDPPDLWQAPPPRIHPELRGRFLSADYATMDCSRGCPFRCSFCTVINVQGRKMRCRSPECVLASIRRHYKESGIRVYFFTDDNFARNPVWEAIFDGLIAMREDERLRIEFVMQVDVAAYRIPRFREKAARAGCSTVFIGMESLNPRNLAEANKTQNRADDFARMISAWREAGVRTHVGYIIGFPNDTEESVRQDVERLIHEVQPDQASFFMMVPLPGSEDHRNLVRKGVPLDADYNNYDSCHVCMPHPHMSATAWQKAYQEAWRRFYSLENLKAILRRAHPHQYWDLFLNLFWYRHAIINEGAHPMLTGIFRLKDRKSRRPCFPRENVVAHLARRIREVGRYLAGVVRLALEMEEVWLATRPRLEIEKRALEELARMGENLRRGLHVEDLQAACRRARANLPARTASPGLQLAWRKVSLWQVGPLRASRRDLTKFWLRLRWRLRHRRFKALLGLHEVAWYAAREARLAAGFLLALSTRAL
ncbi:MAG: radical SAM protein [Bryobacterales bacterium]|nr:radical SAM protein [Bryobacteraceae bacterium]MDW8131027.1 radical SAM protein [Bryobacterales bacterium]